MLSGPNGSHLSCFQIAVQSRCFISLWRLRENESIFSSPWSRSAAWRNGLCGSTSSQNWTEPSAHLSISLFRSLWLSDHSFAVISPFSLDARTEAILEAAVGFHQWRSRISKRERERGQERQKRLEIK